MISSFPRPFRSWISQRAMYDHTGGDLSGSMIGTTRSLLRNTTAARADIGNAKEPGIVAVEVRYMYNYTQLYTYYTRYIYIYIIYYINKHYIYIIKKMEAQTPRYQKQWYTEEAPFLRCFLNVFWSFLYLTSSVSFTIISFIVPEQSFTHT